MSQILVRGLDADIVERLKARAQSHGRSLEGEARTILESAAGFTPAKAQLALSRWRKALGSRKFGDSAKLIREDRRR